MSLFSKKPAEEPQNIDEILAQFKELQQRFEALSQEMEKFKEENRRNISKVAMIRFNPFNEIGSNQSFSLVMLDGNDRGAVVTSLFSRDGNRVYGKPLVQGNSEFKLTEEEKKAIEAAKQQKS